jgi:predicted secreted protein
MNKTFSAFTLAAVLATASLLPLKASADELQLLPEGQTMLTLSVTEREQVQQDTLNASLRIEMNDKNPAALQSKINAAMKKALDLAQPVKSVKASTGYYSVYQTHAEPNNPRGVKSWNGSQTIILESKDAQTVLELASKIQEAGFIMNNLSYSLSTEKADEIRENLMEAALQRAKAKAERAAKGLGKANVELVQVGIDSPVDFPQPYMARQMMSKGGGEMMANFDAAVAAPGESDVTLTINVRAIAK